MANFIQTYMGRVIDFNNFDPSHIDIRDIAYSLSNQTRFNGHLKYPISVAQHSVNVADFVYEYTQDEETALWGLLHDASEAYIGDIPTPFKSLFIEIKEKEDEILEEIVNEYGLVYPMPSIVHEVDVKMLKTEAFVFGGPEVLRSEKDPDDILFWNQDVWSPEEARFKFLERYLEYTGNW